MSNYQMTKESNEIKLRRFNNYLLYFLAFKLPLSSSSSNRSIINYFRILVARNQLAKDNTICSDSGIEVSIVHNLIINKLFKAYL